MTLSELGNALRKMGLDLNTQAGRDALDRILVGFGKSILQYKNNRCSSCWMKKNRGCSPNCELRDLPDDPLISAKAYLVAPNDVSLMSFIFEFVIPIYEQDTGNSGTIEKLRKEFAKRMKREFGNIGTEV